jgi:hypothetical protein
MSNFNAKLFSEDFHIDTAKSGKHYRPGWVNISCPMGCSGHSGYHGGFNIAKGYYNCYRCGNHPLNKVIAVLTGSSFNIAKDIIKKYSLVSGEIKRQNNRKNIPSQIIFPTGTQELTQKAKNYLIGRNFDPDKLTQTWAIQSTGHIGFYKHRILAPIYQRQQLVSYQCRDVTGKSLQKYLACHQEDEIIQHQHCIYGLDQTSHKKCIIVEGITDVWRLGPGAVATFGISFTKQQARLIAMNFNRVFIMFDNEPQAQEQAENLGFLIGSSFGNIVEVINLPFLIDEIDPGELPQNTADEIMSEIGLK